jgi:hypothetical protein
VPHTCSRPNLRGGLFGTICGFKVDYYNGTFTNETKFGTGTANTTPGIFGYTGFINGVEYINYDADSFGREYSGTLKITTAGNYTIKINADNNAYLFIDGVLKSSCVVPIKQKYNETIKQKNKTNI